MRLSDPTTLGAIYGLSEIALGLRRRASPQAQLRDRHSLLLLWMVILISLAIAISIPARYPSAALPHLRAWYLAGVLLFGAGIILRWWAILVLGKFFTVNVAIAKEHRVVETGPYRFVRHPSYTGALMAFGGFGLCLGNWLSILCLIVPITAAFLWRIRVEEQALREALGRDYESYMQRTRCLIPFVY